MSKYVRVDDVMAFINTSNRGNCDYFIVDQIEELCNSNKAIEIVNDLASEHEGCALCYLGSPCEYQNAEVSCEKCDGYNTEEHYCPKFCKVITEAVAEIKENHNNGWISCEERLPEETEQYSTRYDPITLAEVDVEWHTVSDLVNVIVKNYDTDEVFVCDDCTVDGEWANFGSYPFEVLSWQPMPELPAQYKKGE